MSKDQAFIVYEARKKPIVIKCIRVFDPSDPVAYDQWCAILGWINDNGSVAGPLGGEGTGTEDEPYVGYIATLEGEMKFKPGDWIIQGVQGEFYPCQNDIFEATYELVPS